MNPALQEVILALPLAVGFFVSAYVAAMACNAAGLRLDGGKLGWICLVCFAASFALNLAAVCGAMWCLGLLPQQVNA